MSDWINGIGRPPRPGTGVSPVLNLNRTERGATPEGVAESVDMPDLPGDDFNVAGAKPNMEAFVRGRGNGGIPVSELVPNLKHVANLPELAKRFMHDFQVVQNELFGKPDFSGSDKADRAFQFFAAYAEKFVSLATGAEKMPDHEGGDGQGSMSQKALTLEQQKAEARKFLSALNELGFEEMRDPNTGFDGLRSAYILLKSRSQPELERKFNAIVITAEQWPRDEADPLRQQATPGVVDVPDPVRRPPVQDLGESARAAKDRRGEIDRVNGRLDNNMRVQPWAAEAGRVVVQPPQQALRNNPDEAVNRYAGTSNKRLGSNMLWNILHRFRDGPEDEAEQKDVMDRLAFGAALFLVAVAIVVILLVSL